MNLLDVVKDYLDNEAKESSLSDKTIINHDIQFNNIKKFFNDYDLIEVAPSDFKLKYIQIFKSWIADHTKIKTKNTINRHIRILSNAMDLAVVHELAPHNNIPSIKLKGDKRKNIVTLELYEVNALHCYDPIKFKRRSYDYFLARDYFLFQSYTGLSFIDLWLFVFEEDFIINDKGERIDFTWIKGLDGRGKNGNPYYAVFLSEARSIYLKYDGKFPKISNDSYNKKIKIIARDLNINKHLTTHVARKTFATIIKTKGYSDPAIADMLGNTEQTARKHYIVRNKELIKSEMVRIGI